MRPHPHLFQLRSSDPRIALQRPWLSSLCAFLLACIAASAAEFPLPVRSGAEGKLEYSIEADGSRVPDFSHAGYGGGGVSIPHLPARVEVTPGEGDDGARIQAALDHVASLPADASGYRGAVQLAPGRFEIAGSLEIKESGVVLRGAGQQRTVLAATGTGRRTLITIGGRSRRSFGAPRTLLDDSVQVGVSRLRVEDTSDIKPGAAVRIERPSPSEWIRFVGMQESPGRLGYQWKAGTLDVAWDRRVIEVNGDVITLDAPLTTALERRFGGAVIRSYTEEGVLTDCGVERLQIESEFDPANALDENHAWNAIDVNAVRDGWVSDVTAVHFAGSAVQVGDEAARITIQDCVSLAPVSELGGYRRMAFHSRGQQVLFLRCVSEQGRNDFTGGYVTAGPVVFLDCEARESIGFSGSVGSWASGLLFDGTQIDGGTLRLDNLETFNQGVGWAAANSMVWNCAASTVICRTPPGALNHAVGVWGQLVGNGRWSATHQSARPASLYRAQLAERVGLVAALEPREYTEPPADLPSIPVPAAEPETPGAPLTLAGGILRIDGRAISGRNTGTAWWRGRLEPGRAAEFGPAVTRFAPGRDGPGFTDDLVSVANEMARNGQVIFRHHPGLWYDRRRDDHQMTRRADGDVWPPFFEQPFARSGRGKAWDGLSRYDLTKYNPWYFGRLLEFAQRARASGLVLMNEMYLQHTVLESGAHWVDSPWRPVNNVNDTGFTEPPPFSGDTIAMADEFYAVTHPIRGALHRAYIRNHLDLLGSESNVLHALSAENSGPLAFMQFWLDVVAEWERETGRQPLIVLSAPKDVQDAILADPPRAAVVDVIDLTYWFRTDDGKEFAPAGGQSLAPRQHLREWKGGRPSAASITAMAREYRERHPGKAVITGLPEAGNVQPL